MQFTPGSDRSRSPSWLVAALPRVRPIILHERFQTSESSPASTKGRSRLGSLSVLQWVAHDRWNSADKIYHRKAGNRGTDHQPFETPWSTLMGSQRATLGPGFPSEPERPAPLQEGHLPGSLRSEQTLEPRLVPHHVPPSRCSSSGEQDTQPMGRPPPSSTLVTSARA